MSSLSRLTINLKAVVDNWGLLNQKIGSGSRCAAVVKANAYGLGVAPIAKALFEGGCRVFFVATFDEGIELRKSLGPLECEIIVFGGLFYDADEQTCSSSWSRYSLIPVLFSVKHLARWAFFNSQVQKVLPCVIKVDTGMHRMGMSVAELNGQLECGRISELQPSCLMGHFACADKPDHPRNTSQMAIFRECLANIKVHLPAIQASMCNSAGIFLDEDVYYDLVRPGIALYGGNPCLSIPNPMQSVVRLELGVMQVKVVEAGESVGYGASYVAEGKTRLAIVSGGYADGLHRVLSNVGYAYCSGQKVPIVGRVSMDTMAFDVTHVVNSDLSVIDILGKDQTIDDLAHAAGTIGYEILTSLGSRFQRDYVYLDEGVVT
jgi:alanine racemase